MSQQTVSIPMQDGECTASLHTPAGDGPWPGVLMYPDAASLRDTFRAMGERLAGLGYVTLVPDVYYRTDYVPFDAATVFSDPVERERLFTLMRSLGRPEIERDSADYLSFLLARPEVVGSAAGTTGYCMGGGLSLTTAGLHPDRVAAAASFHGGQLASADNPDSAHLLAPAICAEVYVAAAADDPSFPAEQYERLESALTSAGVTHRMETYPAAHGFAVADNPTYDRAADQRHWDALADLYSRLPR